MSTTKKTSRFQRIQDTDVEEWIRENGNLKSLRKIMAFEPIDIWVFWNAILVLPIYHEICHKSLCPIFVCKYSFDDY